MSQIDELIREIDRMTPERAFGEIAWVVGLGAGVRGLERDATIGNQVRIHKSGAGSSDMPLEEQIAQGRVIDGEVMGFRNNMAIIMPFGAMEGIGLGDRVEILSPSVQIHPADDWLGRVIDASAAPLDGKGPLSSGSRPYEVRGQPLPAHQRQRIGRKIDLGVRSVNAFTSLCAGQRLGIFSGSGVGKSLLLAMFARHTRADVVVVGLIGERGRELREFIEVHMQENMAHTVLVVATADQPALLRRQAAHTTMAVAEYFRDRGNNVLCIVDNITRFAMAMREIGLAVGEPPASKGYTPGVFAELPRLLERAGPGTQGQGSITGLFSVLVEGDDLNEPIPDAVRGILDGHIVLAREIAERGRQPAMDVLRSISRAMPACNTAEENRIVEKARSLLATYERMRELIRIGAYREGTDAEVDEAIACYPGIEAFMAQPVEERSDLRTAYQQLAEAIGTRFQD